jgi:hypothetical protein
MHVYEVSLSWAALKERQERWARAYRFEPVDRTPVLTPFHSRYFLAMYGVPAERYWFDPETMLEVQCRWMAWVLNHVRTDAPPLAAWADQSHYGEAWGLGCELGFDPYNTWIKSHPVRDEADLTALAALDIVDGVATRHELATIAALASLAEEYVLRFSDSVEIHPAARVRPGNGTNGLFTLATDLRGPDIYLDTKLRPAFVHRLMEIVLAKVIQRLAWVRSSYGFPMTDAYLCDDAAVSLSPQAYREFVLPYNQRLKAHFGGKLTLHCCGPANHLVPIWADELGIDALWNYSYETDRALVAKHLGGRCVLVGNVNWHTVSQGTAEAVYADALDCLQHFGAYRGYILSTPNIAPETPPANLEAMARAVEDWAQQASVQTADA